MILLNHMPKKEITINNLAVMVQKGFVEVKRDVTTGFKNVDQRFKDVDKRFDEVSQRLVKIERKIDSNHEQRIERLEDDVKWLKGQLTLEGN